MENKFTISARKLVLTTSLLLILQILIVGIPVELKSEELKPDQVYSFTFPQLSKPLKSQIHNSNEPSMLSFHLPQKYNPHKTYHMVLFIEGGEGGYGNSAEKIKSFFDSTEVIAVSFPLYKQSLIPLLADSSNYWSRMMILNEDADIAWKNYGFLLDTLYKIIPNLDHSNNFMGGFSNGGHTTAILINCHEAEITKYFSNFFFIEGGGALENIEAIKKCNLLFLQGGLKKRDGLLHLFEKVKSAGVKADFVKMDGFGHIFPPEYYHVLKNWVQNNLN